jgi:hypothetical protein
MMQMVGTFAEFEALRWRGRKYLTTILSMSCAAVTQSFTLKRFDPDPLALSYFASSIRSALSKSLLSITTGAMVTLCIGFLFRM